MYPEIYAKMLIMRSIFPNLKPSVL